MRDPIELCTDGMAFGGAAVARQASGKVALVHGAAAMERVRARVFRSKKSFDEATVTAVIEPSPERVEPSCPVAGQCGGCSWMHLALEAQRAWKARLLETELARAGVEVTAGTVEALRGGSGLGERARCRLHVEGGEVGFRAARSRQIIPFVRCPALIEPLEAFAVEVAQAARGAAFSPAEVELTVDVAGRRGMWVAVEGEARRWSEIARITGVGAFSQTSGRRQRRQGVVGERLSEASGALRFAYEPGLFVQANRVVNAQLVDVAVTEAGRGARFVELYAGVGNFTLHLARRFDEGIAFEGSGQAAAVLADNVEAQGGGVEVVAESDRRTVERLRSMAPFELLFADPPRAGMRALRPFFESTPPARVVMVSCHPMAAVRDISHLVGRCGYRLRRLVPVDMFPQTHHLELVASLDR
jgi:23S rRNA (uracil1939-C5)-methyltransferase